MVLNVSVSPKTKSNKPLILIRLYFWQHFTCILFIVFVLCYFSTS